MSRGTGIGLENVATGSPARGGVTARFEVLEDVEAEQVQGRLSSMVLGRKAERGVVAGRRRRA